MDLSEPETKMLKMEINYALCIICQQKLTEGLITNPTTHKKVLQSVQENAKYENVKYVSCLLYTSRCV